jgi:hypothetical protein
MTKSDERQAKEGSTLRESSGPKLIMKVPASVRLKADLDDELVSMRDALKKITELVDTPNTHGSSSLKERLALLVDAHESSSAAEEELMRQVRQLLHKSKHVHRQTAPAPPVSFIRPARTVPRESSGGSDQTSHPSGIENFLDGLFGEDESTRITNNAINELVRRTENLEDALDMAQEELDYWRALGGILQERDRMVLVGCWKLAVSKFIEARDDLIKLRSLRDWWGSVKRNKQVN